MTVRDDLALALTPLLPKRWKVVPTQRTLDETRVPVVMLKQLEIERDPDAPNARFKVTYVVTMIASSDDPAKAEVELDDNVVTVLFALDAIEWLNWTRAVKVNWDEKRIAYDITLEAFTKKK